MTPPDTLLDRVETTLTVVSVFKAMSLTNIYIDGFNLYYRALRGTPYKWLDPLRLCSLLLPSHQIHQIKYFTAMVHSKPYDPDVQLRQRAYLRALETLPNLTIHYGMFRNRQKWAMPVHPLPGVTGPIEVWNTEEKGTDVNLASHLLLDGFRGQYEQAVVLSNDADLALAIRMVRDDLAFPVGVVNPNTDPKAVTPRELTAAATFTRRLRVNALARSQFPDPLRDSKGIITKPAPW